MASAKIEKSLYGQTKAGKDVYKYTFTNMNGVQVEVISFGAIIIAVKTPDRNGTFEDITLGYDDIKGFEDNPPYFGSTIGRVANRIANAEFTLDGKTYHLAKNNGPNCLHGGLIGFNKVLWQSSIEEDHVKMSYTSHDGEEGFPGKVKVTVTYSLTEDNEIRINYSATTSKATPINLTNHSYFNLAGQVAKDVLSHVMWIDADKYLPTNKVQIPTGEFRPVTGEPEGAFDFTKPKAIGKDIDKTPPGYDHCFCLNQGEGMKARVVHPESGRVLQIFTNQPGMQLYTGNFLEGNTGKAGLHYHKHDGLALEAQDYPNAINEPSFPNTVLRPGMEYKRHIIFQFLVEK
ncbi:predicted protein [Nematostella vectensis]|uniref:Aldose 1-epimerase n=1 Tax=Nematostella vectensis TaxID=45351 RepID=A7SDT3_NEMVE|nr:predicted protein [Nematostella vectensis]|eukprot:XP_001630193.1 predicted protein [Nematostella vectensis]